VGVEMKNLVPWLCEMEELASKVYEIAAGRFSNDSAFSGFLSKLAEEETVHFQMMSDVAEYYAEKGEAPVSEIMIDMETKDRLEKPLREYYKKIQSQDVSKKEMIDCIVAMEFSEWNDIFLYVFQTCQEKSKSIQQTAATIQDHKMEIEAYIDNLPLDLKPASHVRELPDIWQRRFLIVEDNQQLSDTLGRILSRDGRVEKAVNGREALKKTRENFYDIILTDIAMPVMDGLEFFKQATETDSDIPHHFIFMSGEITPEVQSICKKYRLPFVPKPFSIDHLLQTIQSVLKKKA
jgi:CheY-like chemotaxis protein/rubrerythrin